jgi:hypothetical protein
MKFKLAVQIFVGGIVFIAFLMAILGFNGETIDKIIKILMPLGISFILSAFVGTFLESLSGDTLKKIFIVIPLWKFNISVSLFFIITILIKWWWF